MLFQAKALLPFLPALAAAIAAPNVASFTTVWSDDFSGSAGSSPNSNNWNIALAINTNDEEQTYTTSNSNLQISGGGTIQFVPQKSPSGIWTSGRIESKGSWTPAAGKVMLVQASISLGDNPQSEKQGLWPAFWMLGDSIRHGTPWPQCGEIDIMEQVNGLPTGYGTTHCGNTGGGPCQEPIGRQGTVAMPASGFNTWGVRIDLTNSDWTAQTIQWQLNGATFFTVHGSDIADASVWSTLAHSPLYILMNVAMGVSSNSLLNKHFFAIRVTNSPFQGDWPGTPNSATVGGYGSMMEVAWVGVYST
jgi:beta-glucanase (GH16 family)